MKNSKLLVTLLLLLGLVVTIESCVENGCGQSLVSYFAAHESKRMSGNCMSCHNPNGGGSGCLTVGGTAFDSIPSDNTLKNSIIKLYSQPNGQGELVVTLQVDSSGNFYTTSRVSFGNGLYPAIINNKGSVRYMPSATTNGSCNSCHGVVNAKIWAD